MERELLLPELDTHLKFTETHMFTYKIIQKLAWWNTKQVFFVTECGFVFKNESRVIFYELF